MPISPYPDILDRSYFLLLHLWIVITNNIMAKQESLVKIRGTIGDLSFSKHRERGYEVRAKGGVDKARIMSDPNFERTRENMSEFASAAQMAKVIRLQLNNLSRGVADKSFRNRLVSTVYRIQKADTESPRGQRTFRPENSGQLKGLEINGASSLRFMFGGDLPTAYDRASGEVTLNIPEFNPRDKVTLLEGATHVQFTLAAVEQALDMEELSRPEVQHSAFIPLIGVHPPEAIQVVLPAASDKVVYILVGISTYQEANGAFYPLKNNPYNALTIVDVDLP
jgi:hypothetical protein